MASRTDNMRSNDIPMAPGRGHSSSRYRLKQKLARTTGMLLVQEEDRGPDGVVHRTSSATRNFFGTMSGLRQLASRGSQSWLIRNTSLPTGMNGLDMESTASSFGSVTSFRSRFGSTVDLAGLIGLEDLAVPGTPHELGSQSTQNSIFLRSQLESSSQQISADERPVHGHAGDGISSEQIDDEIVAEQFTLDRTPEKSIGQTSESSAAGVERNLSESAGICLEDGLGKHREEYAAVKIQSAFRASRVRITIQTMQVAATRIQKFYRCHVARIAAKRMQERVVKIQAQACSMKARRQYRKLYNSVVMVQKLWMLAKRRQQKQQEMAATKIQSLFRGWSARKIYQQMICLIILLQACVRRRQALKRYQLLYNTVLFLQRARQSLILQRAKLGQSLQELHLQQQESAALKIQTMCRGKMARKSYNLAIERVIRLQACVRRYQATKLFQQTQTAVLTIQRAWRFHKLHQATIWGQTQDCAAVRMQSAYKGWLARKMYRQEVGRVIMIQSWARRRQGLKAFRELHSSIVIIQRAWRAYRTRQLQQGIEDLDHRGWTHRELDSLGVHKVVYIQACVRRYQVIKHHKELRCAAIVFQRQWRKSKELKFKLKLAAIVRIQSWWRGLYQRSLYQSSHQVQLACIIFIQRRWRGTRLLRSLRLEKWVREKAVICIQAHFRGRRVRRGLQLSRHTALEIESAYQSYLRRKSYSNVMLLKQSCHAFERPIEIMQDQVHVDTFEGQVSNGTQIREEKENALDGLWNTTLTMTTMTRKSSVNATRCFSHTEAESNSFSGDLPAERSVSLSTTDWNDVHIEELHECLDTCLAGLPLASEPSRQLSFSFEVESRSSTTDNLDTTSSSGLVDTGRPAKVDLPEKESWCDTQQISACNVHTTGDGQDIQTTNEAGLTALNPLSSMAQELALSEELASLREEEHRMHIKSVSKEEERLQQFAQIFLTMRQIANQQQHAQSAPPFPPSLEPTSSETSARPTLPTSVSPPLNEVSASPREDHCCLDIEVSVAPPTHTWRQLPTNVEPQRSLNRNEVVLDMVELLKSLEHCYEGGHSEGTGILSEFGDVESGEKWNVPNNGYRRTSTSTLGTKHFKLPDVNAVLIVLVAVVVYTRTVCRDVFYGTRQPHRKL